MWIVFEGIDGAGTTTQAGRLASWLRGEGHAVHETAEPSDGPIGRLVREALRQDFQMESGDRLTPEALALLFAADRVHHAHNEVLPAIRRGEIVVCDRYVHSSLAYQGNELDMEWVAAINSEAPAPDLVIFLELAAEQALRRLDQRGGQREIYEKRSFLEGVCRRYREALERLELRHVILDGHKSVNEVEALVKKHVTQLISDR